MMHALIYLCSLLAPRRLRTAWREEWLGELHAARRTGAARAFRLALGAPLDALSSRWTTREPRDASAWRGPWYTDAKQTFRGLLRSPWHVLAVTLCLGIGIAVSTATFSILNAFVSGGYPGVADAGSLARLYLSTGKEGEARSLFSEFTVDGYRTLAEGSPALTGLAVEGNAQFGVRVPGYEAMNVDGAFVNGAYFTTLGTTPFAGRLLQPADDRADAPIAVVISHAFWKGRLGSPANIAGRPIVIGGRDAFIAGVAPEHFSTLGGDKEPGEEAGVRIKVYVPLAHARAWPGVPPSQSVWLRIWGRMQTPNELAQLSADLQPLAARIEGNNPEAWPNARLVGAIGRMEPGETLGSYLALWILFMAAPVTVLAISCANVANLQLVRASMRARELAVRVSLGAARGQIVRLLTFDAALVALSALAMSALATWILLRAANLVLPLRVEAGWRVAIFAAIVALVSIGATGVLPALVATRQQAAAGFRSGGRSITTGNSRIRRALVVAQISLCFLLLLTAGVFTRGIFVLIGDVPAQADQTLVAELLLDIQESSPARRRAFLDTFDARLRSDPRVRAVGYNNKAPGRTGWITFSLASGQATGQQEAAAIEVANGFFDATGVQLLRGRPLTWTDSQAMTAVVVDETFIEKFELAEPVIGQTLRLELGDEPRHVMIVGVAAAGLTRPLLGKARPTIYLPFVGTIDYVAVWIRTGDAVRMAESVRTIIADIDPDLPPLAVRTLRNYYEVENEPAALIAKAAGGLGSVALLLAVAGLYSVVAFFVALRTNEFGVRMALGARSADIVRMVAGEAGRLVGAGLIVSGLIAVPGLLALHAAFPFTQPFDPLVIVPTALVLAATALAASAIPARRASTIHASIALRAE